MRRSSREWQPVLAVPVVGTKHLQNLGAGIKDKCNSTIEETGALVVWILEAGNTPCDIWDWSKFVPLANSIHVISWGQVQSPWGSLELKLILRGCSFCFIHLLMHVCSPDRQLAFRSCRQVFVKVPMNSRIFSYLFVMVQLTIKTEVK